ncbi:MAG: PAS domain S-box protein [Syntrophales bacterium]|jgi:PAS domain S-box-containing protein
MLRKLFEKIREYFLLASPEEENAAELQGDALSFRIISIFGIVFLGIFGITAIHRNDYTAAFLYIAVSVVLVINHVHAAISHKTKPNITVGLFFIYLTLLFVFLTGRPNQSAILWYFILPILFFFFQGSRRGLICTILSLLPPATLFLHPHPEPYFAYYSPDMKVRFLASFFIITTFIFFIERARERGLKALSNAQANLEKRVEERTQELKESEEKYRTIIENMDEGYIEVDLTGRLTFFNEAAQKFFGYSAEETMGMHFKQYADEGTAQKMSTVYSVVYRTGVPLRQFEWEAIRKDGARRTVEGSVSLIRDIEGQPIRFRALFQDITDRKHLQEERQRLQELLHRGEKMEALGTLAGGVAHDLNNVLGIVVGYSELLLSEMDETSEARSRVMNIMQGGERAAAIVQDLLTLARRGVQTRKVININTTIDDYQKSPEFEKLRSFHSNVRIEIKLEEGLLNIIGSPVHLSKTLFNLVSNAVEAMPDGGEVAVTTRNVYLDRPIQGYDDVKEGDYVVLSVSDTGGGIPSADLKRIFEPFYTKKVMGRSGTGLGLAVVWGTVKDHNGYINVESKEGKGTTFNLYFPITREEIFNDQIHVSVSEYMGNGETILVVDDVEGQSKLAAQMLTKLNYSVSNVYSGEEALAYLKEHNVDLMVLDMIMEPGMDGLDTYRSVLKIHPGQKAIIVSGFSETGRVHTAQALGAGTYVRKPYVMEKLGLAVRTELDRK